MKNILVRADSSSKIGIGHIMRDLVLVQKYQNSNITFACQDLEGNITNKIKESGHKVEILQSNDLEELNILIKKLGIDFLIIDHYGIDFSYEKELKGKNPNLKIFVFDDTYEKHFCNILLNHNIYAKKRKYETLVPSFCEIRCGEEFTLIRDEFKKKYISKEKNINFKILIAFGGTDFNNLTLKVLKRLAIFKNIEFEILTTSANKNINSLKKYVSLRKNISLHINSNNVAKIINSIDLAIVSPSTILHEIIYLKKDFIAIQTASNQIYMVEYLEKKNLNVLKKFDGCSLLKKVKNFI